MVFHLVVERIILALIVCLADQCILLHHFLKSVAIAVFCALGIRSLGYVLDSASEMLWSLGKVTDT